MARPSDFTQLLADEICQRIADGESLLSICESDYMPPTKTVYAWLQHPDRVEFRSDFTRARDTQADAFADRIHKVATTPHRELLPDGKLSGDMIEHRRLQIETLKWLAGKQRPTKYGEVLKMKHVGGDAGDAPVAIAHTRARDLTSDDLAAIAARALPKPEPE